MTTPSDRPTTFTIRLPGWIDAVLAEPLTPFPTVEDRMNFVLELSRRNSAAKSGGPFAAAVFDLDSTHLIAAGVNIVVSSGCSVAHAEIMALTLAQQVLGSHDLSAEGLPPCELVTSTEPCAMCLGAIPWSGVSSVVCGARGEDARAIGFDEGAKPADWPRELEKRGIRVTRDVFRKQAVQILQDYASGEGEIYNPCRGNALPS